MALYLSKASEDMHRYIKRSYGVKKIRELSPRELEMVADLYEEIRMINLCITELVLIRNVILYLEINELSYVRNNISRIILSLQKQRDLVCAAKLAFSSIKPNEEEMRGIEKLAEEIKVRIHYLRSIPIPENIKLTPIQDYLELVGKEDFIAEVKKQFPTYRDIVESQQNGEMMKYVSYIMKSLEDSGKADAYKPRLSAFAIADEKRKAAAKKEKKMEIEETAKNEAQNGMLVFKDLFFRSIRTLTGIDRIGTSTSMIRQLMNKGARGKMCVLCCYSFRGEFVFRYMNKNGSASARFGPAVCLYETYDDAVKDAKAFQATYPLKEFAVVTI